MAAYGFRLKWINQIKFMDKSINQNNGEPGTSEKKKKVTKYCSVPQCNNYYRQGLSFHLFPKNEDGRRRWEVALKMGKSASPTMYVCGEHFLPSDYFPSGTNKKRTLYPHAVPSQNLPVRPLDQKQNTSPRKRARQARSTRAQERHVKKIRILEESGSGTEEFAQPPSPAPNPRPPGKAHILTQANLSDERTVFISNEEGHSIADVQSEGRNEKATQVHLNKKEKSSSASASAQSSKPLNLAEVLISDSKPFTFTGIHSLDLLESLVKCVQDIDTVHTTSKCFW